MRGICLPNESLYTDVRIQNLILDKFQGICFAGNRQGYEFYTANADKLSRSLALNGDFMGTGLRCYVDEPISTPTPEINLDKILRYNPTAIIGESNPTLFKSLVLKYPNCKVTYTAYRQFLFRIFGVNISNPFSNQIPTWSNYMCNALPLSKMAIFWINLPLNKGQYTQLENWIKGSGKEVWYYAEINLTADQVIKELERI